jgi:hypothetical protein
MHLAYQHIQTLDWPSVGPRIVIARRLRTIANAHQAANPQTTPRLVLT